jgi:hypothetical protein
VPQVETHELQIVTLQRVTDKRHYVRYSERYCTAAACAHQRPHDGGLVIFRHGQAVAGQRARAAAYAPSGSELPWRRRAARSGRLGSATSTPTACSTGSTPHRSWRSLPPRRSRWPQCLGPTSRRLVTGRARREFPVCQRFNGIGDDRDMVAVQMGIDAAKHRAARCRPNPGSFLGQARLLLDQPRVTATAWRLSQLEWLRNTRDTTHSIRTGEQLIAEVVATFAGILHLLGSPATAVKSRRPGRHASACCGHGPVAVS